MEWRRRLSRVKNVTLRRPYLYYFILIVVAYIFLNILVNKAYIVFPVMFGYNLAIVVPFLLLSLLVAFLVALNFNLIIFLFKEWRQLNKESSLTFFGLFGGMLGGVCPGCFAGLFPAFLGIFGITASLSTLPFLGIEILIGSAAFLLVSTFLLTRDNVCKIKTKRDKK